jgi:site-specific DNA recombinase
MPRPVNCDEIDSGSNPEPDQTPAAVIYLRVSTKEQAEMGGEAEGFSIPAQRAACLRKAESLGAVVDEEFVDRGESAKTAQRPELLRMLRYLQEHPKRFVIVHKVDRLARNRADDIAISMEIQKSGAQLVSCSENIDETPSGLLLHGIMSAIAEFYSRNLATEVMKGIDQKAMTGGTVRKSPIGYRHVRQMQDGRELRSVEIDPERGPLVRWAFEAYATGDWTLPLLREELTDRGLTTRPGPHTPARPISRSALHGVLRNPYYTGVVVHRGVQYPGKHEPLINKELFALVEAALTAHNHAGERQYVHNHYLKGSVFCGSCGSRLAVEYSRSRNGNIYDYFYCLGRQRNPRSCNWRAVRVQTVEQRIVDHYRDIQLTPERIAQTMGILRGALSSRRQEAEAAERVESLRIQRLSGEREKLLRLHYAEAVPIDLFKQEQERITRELENARKQLATVSIAFDAIEQNMNRALALAKDCHAAYVGASPEIRRQFNQAFFHKLNVHEDGEVTHDLAEPFKILLDPQLARRLSQDANAQNGASNAAEPGKAISENDLTQSEAVGSNFDTVVGAPGFEPGTSSLSETRSNQLSYAPTDQRV